jgi:hypothetical protein
MRSSPHSNTEPSVENCDHMKTSAVVTLLLAALVSLTFTGCQWDWGTVYFGQQPPGIGYVQLRGGAPKVLLDHSTSMIGIVYAPKERVLYTTDEGAIYRFSLEGEQMARVFEPRGANGVAVDENGGRLYWGEDSEKRIVSCNLQGQDSRVLVTGVNFPHAVSVNPKLGLLYWVQEAPNRGVWMSRLNGTESHLISAEEALPAALTVDAESGRIFWARQRLFDWPGRIVTANSDGSDAKIVFSDASSSIEGLAVDKINNRVVWIERRSDGQPARIRNVKFDGTEVRTTCEFTGGEFAKSVTVGPPRQQ